MTDFTKKILHRVFSAFVLATIFAGSARSESFDAFVAALWRDAQAQGISRAAFDTGLAGVTPDARVTGAMSHAPEYGKPFGVYVNAMVSSSRLGDAARKSAQWADTLRAVEKKFGVPAPILVSIWGVESSFGESQDHWDVFRSLTTLAQAHIQEPFFHDELLSAFRILQSNNIPRRQFLGSYAGAMAPPTSGPMSLTCSDRLRITCRNPAGNPA